MQGLVVWFLVVGGVGASLWDGLEYTTTTRQVLDDPDFEDYYDEEDMVPPSTLPMTPPEARTQTRVRRYGAPPLVARTLSAEEINEVKGVLKEVMSGRNVFEMNTTLTTSAVEQLTSIVELVTSTPSFVGLTKSSHPTRSAGLPLPSGFRATLQQGTTLYDSLVEEIIDNARKQGGTATHEHHTGTGHIDSELRTGNATLEDQDLVEAGLDDKNQSKASKGKTKPKPTTPHVCHNYTTSRVRMTRRKTTTTTTPKEVIDIETLVEIIANLTLDYELINITDLFNKTLMKYNIPKCLAPTTTVITTSTTTEEPGPDLLNATIISKCFVCGLATPGIPTNAYCADAFAGDFLPLVPVDPQAKGQIARYRKYCRYLDIPGVYENDTQPRSVFGRWTGGCSVRWIDLSGIYTQRACRNRRRAVMGRHFVSKRMAKLEMALVKEDEGCIISPMSSLVPLSRGISLYARFHACVCTGNWCNEAPLAVTTGLVPWVLFLVSCLKWAG